MKKYKKIYIEITNNCNLNCSFCSPVKRKRKNITIKEFETILKKVKDYTDYIYLHIKGEPLLHPQIIELLKKAEEYDLKVNLTTNGTLLPKYAKLLSSCKSLNKINISASLTGLKEDYYFYKSIPNIFRNVPNIIELDISNNEYKGKNYNNKIFQNIRLSMPKKLTNLKILDEDSSKLQNNINYLNDIFGPLID